MTREEKIARARELRDAGLKLREIGDRLEAPLGTVWTWINDPDGARSRARKDSYRGTCKDCGDPTHGSNGAAQAPSYCAPCTWRRTHEGRHWTPERVVAELRAWSAELGRTPTASDALVGGARVPCVVTQREFGSWALALRAAGMEPTRPQLSGRALEAACAEAARLYEAGYASTEIADVQGIEPESVRNRLRLAGVAIRTPAESRRLRQLREAA